MSIASYLDPETISRLMRLDWIARLVVEGFVTGLHRSPYHGFSVEFSDHRPYLSGDPLRNIDWKAYAKSDRLYVKQYEEETNLKAYLLLDVSGSMAFRGDSVPISKYRYASALTAAITHLMLRQRDAVGLMLFSNKIESYIPPRSVNGHFENIVQVIEKSDPGNDTNIAPAFNELAEKIPRRGLVIVLSDLLDEPSEVIRGLRHFRHRGHEVVVLHILDPREQDLEITGTKKFVSLEDSEETLTSQPWHMQREYALMMSGLVDKYRKDCVESGIDYVQVDTATRFDVGLSGYLSKRQKMG